MTFVQSLGVLRAIVLHRWQTPLRFRKVWRLELVNVSRSEVWVCRNTSETSSLGSLRHNWSCSAVNTLAIASFASSSWSRTRRVSSIRFCRSAIWVHGAHVSVGLHKIEEFWNRRFAFPVPLQCVHKDKGIWFLVEVLTAW